MDGQKYIGQGKSKKLARIDAASNALRDFIQFKDQALKNGVIGINSHLLCHTLSSATLPATANSNNSNLNNNNYDFTSDMFEDNTTGILLNSNNIDNSCNIDNTKTIKSNQLLLNSINTNTLEDDNLVKKIQQTLECLKSDTDQNSNSNHAWVNRLQSKYFLSFIISRLIFLLLLFLLTLFVLFFLSFVFLFLFVGYGICFPF